jgi:hypothetical protein
MNIQQYYKYDKVMILLVLRTLFSSGRSGYFLTRGQKLFRLPKVASTPLQDSDRNELK